jgi:putative DNA primase/helicase
MTFGYNGPEVTGDEAVVWKCEGLTDALAIQSLIEAMEPPVNHIAVCNASGSEESPISPGGIAFLRRLESVAEVFVIHDADEPGQRGATWVEGRSGRRRPGWAPAIAQYAPLVKNVILPYPLAESHGRDVRDWIAEQSAVGKSDPEIYAELIDLARSMPKVDPPVSIAAPLAPKPKSDFPAANPDPLGDEAAGNLPGVGGQLIAKPVEGSAESPTAEAETEANDPKSLDSSADGGNPVGEPKADGGKAEENPADSNEEVLESVDDPDRLARLNLSHYETNHGGRLLYWRGEWWKWKGGCWYQIDEESLKAKVHATVRHEFEARWKEEEDRRIAEELKTGEKSSPKAIKKVTTTLIRNVIDAIKSHVTLSSRVDLPCWLPTREPRNLVSMQNGILDMDALFAGKDEADCLMDHTPEWFSGVKLPYEFQPEGHCDFWLTWLNEVFNGDQESIEALQMWMGYLLTQENYLHKILMIIGETRSGKGTINQVISEMIGRHAIAYPTLTDMGDKFELHGLVGKSVAIFSDVRLSDRADEHVITERLLSISGGDPQDIKRKHLRDLHGVTLPVRFILFSNALPRLKDVSAAVLNRFLVLLMPNSYLGREDHTIFPKLKKEMPGILLWSIFGRLKLQERGKIDQPSSAMELLDAFRANVAPVSKFLSENCERTGEVEVSTLWEAWLEFCRDNGMPDPKSIQTFGNQIRAVMPNLKISRIREGDGRVRKYIGISLRAQVFAKTASF